jgi:cytochrome d ubiquinol oxidase subunit I
MSFDAVFLSRLQFFWVVALHILLPAFTVGLASYIAVLEGLHLTTGRPVYLRLSKFWLKVFAVSFGMGVVSGIVMPFQFGTNWSRFSDATADIVGPLMAYEGLTAFLAALGLFAMCYLGLGISIVPMIVPYTVTLWAAASAAKSQAFMVVGTLFLLPIIVMYTGWSYWVFRGKVRAGSGYH